MTDMTKSQTLYTAARRRGMSPTNARTLVGAAVRLGGAQWRAFTTWAEAWEAASAPIVTRDRYGTRAYVWPTGESVCNDGYGRMSWSLYVGNEWTACYDSRGEALADYGLVL